MAKQQCVWCGKELEWPAGIGETPCCSDPECESELADEEQDRLVKILAIDLAAVWRRHVAICIPGGDLAKQDGDPIERTLAQVLGYATDYDGVFVAIDRPPYWRTTEFSGYKANRTALDPGVHEMYRRLGKHIQKELRWPILHAEGFEADDVIATACQQLGMIDAQVMIVTSDKDIRQCIQAGVELLNVAASKDDDPVWDDERVFREMGVTPTQIPLYLALVGDDSDNLPGVKGLGPKTAVTILGKPVEGRVRMDDPKELKPEHMSARLWQALCDADPDVSLQYRLTTLRTDVPIDAPGKLRLRAVGDAPSPPDSEPEPESESEPPRRPEAREQLKAWLDDKMTKEESDDIAETMGAPVGSSLDGALLNAQRLIRSVRKGSRVSVGQGGGYDYASSEDVIREARGVLLACGVTAFREGWRTEYRPGAWTMPGTYKRPEPITMPGAWVCVLRIRISHPDSGEVRYTEAEHPVIPTAGRALDKATSATLTTCLGYWYIGLLQIPRGDEVDAHDYDEHGQ